jgi:hypothetical protein
MFMLASFYSGRTPRRALPGRAAAGNASPCSLAGLAIHGSNQANQGRDPGRFLIRRSMKRG